MEYREFPPKPVLAPFVERLWTLTGHAAELDGASQPILPDGRPELVMHFGDAFERIEPGRTSSRQARLLFAGQLTEQLTLRPTGAVAVLGVRFHAFGASAVLPAPQHCLAGLTAAVDDLSAPLARELGRVAGQTDDVACAVALVERALERCLRAERVDARVRLATKAILDAQGAVSIDGLAEQVSMSRRHLERRFLDAVGISPKRLARITRFQRALRVLEASDPRRRGTVTAAACGYADQSHFIREFRQLAGCSPAEHLLTQGELTGFFVTGIRHSSQRR
ncbi:MAG TPA: helix-turn-helix transcriptional regulator [Vicinamibacterales bacterium]|nr:helix-turn-helix transcriptional regulator [Vicinamibacterales bacterium]